MTLLGEYRAAVARYSDAVTELSFAPEGFSREHFQAQWHGLEASRLKTEELRAQLIEHIREHGC
jgi:hypothetical protein